MTFTLTCNHITYNEKGDKVGRYSVDFMDGDTRCHVWLGANVVHRNTPTGETYPDGRAKYNHRRSDLQAKKYDDLRNFIAAIDDDQRQIALQACIEKKQAEAKAEADAAYKKALETVPYMRAVLAESGDRALIVLTDMLSDRELIRLRDLLERGKHEHRNVKNGYATAAAT